MDVFRKFQLRVMGVIAITLSPIAIFLVMVVHQYPAPMSISETATIPWRTDFLLPLCLGALALFCLTYSLKYSYDCKLDKSLTLGMFVGFTLVAVQVCASPHIDPDQTQIGLFGVSQQVSHIIHVIGAIGGFGSMIFWILLCFTKSNKNYRDMTPLKKFRNTLYRCLAIGMFASLFIVVFDYIGFFGEDFPLVFVVEWIMLTLGGLACLVKGGLLFKDGGHCHD